MDNNWCGMEDAKFYDLEDWKDFVKEIRQEIVKSLVAGETITCHDLKNRVGALELTDVYDAAKEAGYTIQLR